MMRSKKAIEDVYIRIVDEEPSFICTIQRDGVIERALRYAVAVKPQESTEISDDVAREALPVLRPRRRLLFGDQDSRES